MPTSNPPVPAVQIVGTVRRVDVISRELEVAAAGAVLTLDVPPDGTVLLHGEPVKFRMVQPRDRVRVSCTDRGGCLVARRVEVEPVTEPSRS